jgi:glycosyltransferase involved in cell wall biosynthesis
LTVGRLAPGKGLEDLIQAAGMISKRGNKVKFLIVGDGPLREPLERQTAANRLERQVILKGHISNRSELVELYRKADLFVFPSHHEGLPTVILEAMACGCPVLATEVGALPQVVTDGANGRLLPPGQPHRLADLIGSLLGSPETLSRMGVNARQTVVERFSWDQISANFLRLYEAMLDGALG